MEVVVVVVVVMVVVVGVVGVVGAVGVCDGGGGGVGGSGGGCGGGGRSVWCCALGWCIPRSTCVRSRRCGLMLPLGCSRASCPSCVLRRFC